MPGGDFGAAGGVPAHNIAKWDGNAWSPVATGINGSISALAVIGTNLYAGGAFNWIGGVRANSVAKWDGRAWSALGSGVSAYVDVLALAVSGTNLYAGGNFKVAGRVSAKYNAGWDGSTWSALGSGMDNVVEALVADEAGHLFVGGAFSMAGTKISPNIAQANVGGTPNVIMRLPTQTAEAGTSVYVMLDATGEPPPVYQWYFNGSNLLTCTCTELALTNLQVSQSGTYIVVATNVPGSVSSTPALLNVIEPVQRRLVPGVKVTGQSGSLVNVDHADSLSPAPNWTTLGSLSLTSPPQYYFDLTLPLPPQRFYRAWQTGPASVAPSLDLHLVPALTLTGAIGSSVRVDYINRVGPINAWITLDTVTLTNTSQLYLDVSAWGQPQRLYRLVPSP